MNDAHFWNDRKIFNGEMIEVEKEIEAKWTKVDEAHYATKLNLRNTRDDITEKERAKVAAMALEQRDKVRLVAEEAVAVDTARSASSSNRSGLTNVQTILVVTVSV
jgi:hypothetical protein